VCDGLREGCGGRKRIIADSETQEAAIWSRLTGMMRRKICVTHLGSRTSDSDRLTDDAGTNPESIAQRNPKYGENTFYVGLIVETGRNGKAGGRLTTPYSLHTEFELVLAGNWDEGLQKS